MPAHMIDLMAEFKLLTSGMDNNRLPHGRGLLGAMNYFKLDGMDALEKKSMQDLAIRGGPFTDTEQVDLLDYCERDVRALMLLLPAMMSKINLGHALVRGDYQCANAKIEWRGIPVDVEYLNRLKANWTDIQNALVQDIDPLGEIYEGRAFRINRF